jgi:hypothetical protein
MLGKDLGKYEISVFLTSETYFHNIGPIGSKLEGMVEQALANALAMFLHVSSRSGKWQILNYLFGWRRVAL